MFTFAILHMKAFDQHSRVKNLRNKGRFMFLRILAPAALIVFSGQAFAQDNGTARTNDAENSFDMDRVQCRAVKQLGSRIPNRVCRTAAEWVKIEKENAEIVEEQRRHRSSAGDIND